MSPSHRRTARPISRRRLLAAGGLAFAVLGVATTEQACAQDRASPQRDASPRADGSPRVDGSPHVDASQLKRTSIGKSQGGQPINLVHLGGDRRRVLVLGGQHGSPEGNAVMLADAILSYFAEHERELPKGIGLDVITVANPDGFIDGSRQYRSGVDPNRNWASGDWEPDAYDSLGQYWHGLGGPTPMSEPETRALASWITRWRPALVVNYHSAGGFVSTGQTGLSWDLADVYAEASGYPSFGPDRPPFGYAITGAMDGWLAGRRIADIFVELTTFEDPEIEENLAGMSAVLRHLAG
jgi:hypothetical protein